MRSYLLMASLILALSPLSARTGQVSDRIMALKEQGVRFGAVQLFRAEPANEAVDRRWKGALRAAQVLRFDPSALATVVRGAPDHIALELPGRTLLVLDLQRITITTDDFVLSTASGSRQTGSDGVHYRGMVRGIPGSWAAISLFGREVMGLINDGSGTFVLGGFEDRMDDLHVLYREEDLLQRSTATCGLREEGPVHHSAELTTNGVDRTVRCVRYYWEVNYNVFVGKGGLANTTTYITGLFNQSAILFDNDGIDVTLSELFIWDEASPYTGPGSGDFLDQFGVERTNFNGDMAHLIGYGGGGGVAWLNTLCNSQSRFRMAYSGINSTFSNVPTYSWSVNVVSHEQGHNLGSSHTHGCVWNGDGTAIDGCGPSAGYPEGTCAAAPLPTGGGTVMSYCHLVGGVGINFNNGFGPQPSALMINRVNGATCLTTCGTTCDAPGTLTVNNITTTSANLSWAAVGATGYTLRWKAVANSTWTVVTGLTGNTYALTGLTQGTLYEFQVLSICGASSSTYSTSRQFTTLVPCPDSLEPNNSLGAPADIVLPADVSALIAVSGDLDYYRFTLSSTRTITASITNLAGDYDLRLLNSTGATLAASEAGGTTSEFINYPNAPAGTYFVYVFGYNGANSPTQCYALQVRSFAPACEAPDGLTISAVTYNSATVSWPTVQGASSYDLRWKLTSDATWINETGLTATTYDLTGLASESSYDVQVRTVCPGVQGSGPSAYTETEQFVTMEVPCSVVPRIQFSIGILLDGPYHAATGLMTDSLRVHGLLPLQEPYTALGYSVTETVSTTAAVLSVHGEDAVVDWVLVELRESIPPYAVVETRAGLLQRDGDIIHPDGTAFMRFCSEGGTGYRIAIRHRNHLGVMSGIAFSPGPLPTWVGVVPSHGTDAMRQRDGVWLMWAGNCTTDDMVKYTGDVNDRDAVLNAIGGTIPTNTATGYFLQDLNLDGAVKYTGPDNDRDLILNTVGGSVPTNTRVEQLP